MKVLFISGGDYKYGAPKSMMTLMQALKDEYQVVPVLLTKRRNALNQYCDRHGIENYSCWYRDIMAGSPYDNPFLTLLKHLVKYAGYVLGGFSKWKVAALPIDFEAVDIIHTNTNRQDIGAYLAGRYHKPHVWHIREMGREDYNVCFYKRNCIRYMNSHADAFVAISHAVGRKWLEKGISPDKLKVIYNGQEPEGISPKAAREDGLVRIIITGHVQPNKGQLQLVLAVAGLPGNIRERVRVDIVGECYAGYRKKIEAVIRQGGLERQVRLLGYQNNIAGLLSHYDIGVTSSKAEGFGRCTLEYLMAGLFTIASDTGANPEIIEDRRTGLLYQYGNIESLSGAIAWSVLHEEEREKIARAGRRAAKEDYSQHKSAEAVYEVYQTCIRSH